MFLYLRKDSLILAGISLLLVFGQKDHKIGLFVRILESFVILFSLKLSERRIIVINLAWLVMAKSMQNYTSEIYSKDRYGHVSFVY